MRREIREWIAMDDDRRRVYETDALYHAQAMVLSTTLDAVEGALHRSGMPVVAVAQAMHAATVAVLGSIEAAEKRAEDHQAMVRRLEVEGSALRKGGYPSGDEPLDPPIAPAGPAPGAMRSRLEPVCQIPGCGCDGTAHP